MHGRQILKHDYWLPDDAVMPAAHGCSMHDVRDIARVKLKCEDRPRWELVGNWQNTPGFRATRIAEIFQLATRQIKDVGHA